MVANTAADLKNHMGKDLTAWQEKLQQVCYHFRNGFCFRGDSCRFSHVGVIRNNSGSTSTSGMVNNWIPACNKGVGCSLLARGACKFFHSGVGIQKQDSAHQRTNQTSGRPQGRQSFNTNSQSDFPPMRRGNQQMRKNTGRY